MDRIKDLREQYFKMRDLLHATGTGFSKAELHIAAKMTIFPYLVDEEANWNLIDYSEQHILNSPSPSINWLSEKGLESFIENFRGFALNNFNVAI